MTIPAFNLIIVFLWVCFVAYWAISAIGVKKNIRTGDWAGAAGVRILLFVIIILILQVTSSWRFLAYQFPPGVQAVGVILAALGIGFAIWARRHLGKNWSGIPTMKEGHELVTSGPYRFVRHPIYTGMLAALFGSALVVGIVWLIVAIVFSANLLYRIPIEERYMMQLFPDQYPEYKKRTKALIPFVW